MAFPPRSTISFTTSSAIFSSPLPSGLAPKSLTKTFAPSLAKKRAVSFTIPLPATVNIATLSFKIDILSPHLN